MKQKVNLNHWLTPQAFAERIQCSTSYVYRKINVGKIPCRSIPEVSNRAIHQRYVKQFNPFPRHLHLFHVEDIIGRTGLSKQTICDLLNNGKVHFSVSDGEGHYEKRVIKLDATKSGKRWLFPESTISAFEKAVKPTLANWPTVNDIASSLGSSNAYVLKLFEEGKLRGQQSIAGGRIYLHPTVINALEVVNGCPHSIGEVAEKTGLAPSSLSDIARRGRVLRKYTTGDSQLVNEQVAITTTNRLKRYWFSEESLRVLLKATEPDRLNWPTARELEEKLELCNGALSARFLKGEIRGAISIIGKGRKLHIEPCDADTIGFQSQHSISVVAQVAGVTTGTFRQWNKCSPYPFVKAGLLEREYVTAQTLERVRELAGLGKMKRSTAWLLGLPQAEYKRAILKQVHHALLFDPEKPPSIDDCESQMRIEHVDGRKGLIQKVIHDPFRPMIQVEIAEDGDEKAVYLYAVARSCGCQGGETLCVCDPQQVKNWAKRDGLLRAYRTRQNRDNGIVNI
jgi:hypothetical protein